MWPDGCVENISLEEKSHAVSAVAIAEQRGIGKQKRSSAGSNYVGDDSENNNPFLRINKTFP